MEDIKKEFESEIDTENVIGVKIKEEPELIIEDDVQWTPAKFEDEENDYYQEFFEEYDQSSSNGVRGAEVYTIRFLDESKDYIEDESDDYYSEGEDDEYQNSNSDEDFDTLNNSLDFGNLEAPRKPEPSDSEYQKQLNKWLASNFIQQECPVCNDRFQKYKELRQHFEKSHKECIMETEKNYIIGNDGSGVCKKCNKKFSTISFRYFHSLTHEENSDKMGINVCKLCNFKTNNFFVQRHILESHPEITKNFKASNYSKIIKDKCPLCPYYYNSHREISCHFMHKHPNEYRSKVNFNCHLCACEAFDKEEKFLQHLAESHELNSWQTLNFRKISEDNDFVACSECGSLFVQSNTIKMLKHFLTHESKSFLTCKFCSKQSSFEKITFRHVCYKLIHYYKKCNNDINSIDNYAVKQECQITNIQEFENYIAHVCPFCNEEFSKMLKWQKHLKRNHAIGTLKGLEMKKLVNDDNKLCCEICHALVVNSPEKLHAHRFQHLPFKPYKCFSCSCALSTFKMAVNHVLKQCKDDDDRDSVSDIRSILEMQCTLCNNKKFIDVRSSYKHYEDEHNNFEELFIKNANKSVTCRICYQQVLYNYKKPYFLHIINHFDEKTFQCKLCLQSYATLKGINNHFLTHPSTKNFYQQAGAKNYNETVSLDDKSVRTTKNGTTTLAVSSIKSYVLNEFAEFISFVCPECNEDMVSQPIWHTHIATQHSFFKESNIYFKDVDGSLKCTTCKMKLPKSPIQQQKHKLTHMPYKSFMCNLCYARCNSLGVLYGHFRRRHFAKGSFVCPLCPETLPTSYQRTKHLKDTHPREEWPDSLCLICYQILRSPYGLRIHMQIHDMDRVRYTCEICNTKIFVLKDYKLHIERHKKRGEVKNELRDDIIAHSESEEAHSNENGKNLNKITDLVDGLKDGSQHYDDQIAVFPATKKKKFESGEV